MKKPLNYDTTRGSNIVTEQERSLAVPTKHRPSHARNSVASFVFLAFSQLFRIFFYWHIWPI